MYKHASYINIGSTLILSFLVFRLWQFTMKMDIPHEIGTISAKAKALHNEDRLREAVICYEQAYKLSRQLSDDDLEKACAFNLAAAYLANNATDKALEYLHKAEPAQTNNDPEAFGDLYFNYGLAYEKQEHFDKAVEYYEKACRCFQTDLQMVCLDKCLTIHQKQRDHGHCADVCKKMAVLYDTSSLKKAEKMSDAATYLKTAGRADDALKAAQEAAQLLDEFKDNQLRPNGLCDRGTTIVYICVLIYLMMYFVFSDFLLCKNDTLQTYDNTPNINKMTLLKCIIFNFMFLIISAKILNDLGLLMTQTQHLADAMSYFEKALEDVIKANSRNKQLEAVIRQNLGAAYNFNGDFQRSLVYHKKAQKLYGKCLLKSCL